MIAGLAFLLAAGLLARRAGPDAVAVPGAPPQAIKPPTHSSAWAALAAHIRDLRRYYSGVVGKPLKITPQIVGRVAHVGPLAVADELIAPGLVPPRRPR